MIQKWSKLNLVKDLEYVKNGSNLLGDDGKNIKSWIDWTINLIGLIDSKKGQLDDISSSARAKMFIYQRSNNWNFSRYHNPNSPK